MAKYEIGAWIFAELFEYEKNCLSQMLCWGILFRMVVCAQKFWAFQFVLLLYNNFEKLPKRPERKAKKKPRQQDARSTFKVNWRCGDCCNPSRLNPVRARCHHRTHCGDTKIYTYNINLITFYHYIIHMWDIYVNQQKFE